MRKLLIFLLLFSVFGAFAQLDSLAVETEDIVNDSIASVPLLPTDTLKTDTVFLSSHKESWSRIEEDSIDVTPIVVRKDSGLVLITAKIGFSDNTDNTDIAGYSTHTFAPMALQVEYFHNDFFSYGGQLVYSRHKYDNDTLSTTYLKNSTVGLAALGTFHYGSWLQDVTHNKLKFGYLDLYLSMAVRLDIHRQVEGGAWNEELQLFESDVKHKDVSAKVRVRPIFGARYYISDRFSLNIELGKGNLGMLTSSVSWLISRP